MKLSENIYKQAMGRIRQWIPIRFLLIFLLSFLFILFIGWIYYEQTKKQLEEKARQDLAAIADLKIEQISNWLLERQGDAILISNNPLIMPRLKTFLEKTSPTDADDDIRAWLMAVKNHYNYENILLVDAKMDVRLSVGTSQFVIDTEDRKVITDVIEAKKPSISDLHRSEKTDLVHMAVFAPLLWKKDTAAAPSCIGVVIMEVNPDEFLFPMLKDWPTHSLTAETLLVRREGDKVVFLSDLRHSKFPPLTLQLPLTKTNMPAVMVVLGKSGYMEGVDYRNVPVVGTLRQIPEKSWGMVAKIDREEVVSPIRQRAIIIGGSALTLILLMGLTLLFLWKRKDAEFYKDKLIMEQDRNNLKEALDYSEQQSRLILESIADGVHGLDKQGRITFENKAALVIFGFESEEMIGKQAHPLIHHHRADGTEYPAEECPAYRTLHDGETRYVENEVFFRKDGSSFPVVYASYPLKDKDGIITGVVVVFRDISLKKHAEEEYRTIVQTSLDGFWITDTVEGRFLEVNNAYCSMVGYTYGELLQMRISDIEAKESQEETRRHIQVLIEKGFERFESKHRCKNGTVINVEISAQYSKARDGIFVVFIKDTTKHKMAEKELRISEEKYKLLADHSADIIYKLKLEDENFIYASPSAERLLGYSSKEIATLTVKDVMTQKSYERHLKRLEQNLAIGSKEPLILEMDAIHKSGHIIPVEIHANFIYDAQGSPVEILGIARDITERKWAEKQMREQSQLLDLARDTIIIADLNRRITFWNQGAETMYGWTSEEAKGKLMHELFQSQFPESIETIEHVLMNEGHWEGEIIQSHRDGSHLTVLSRQLLQRNEEGQPIGIFEINIDITIQKLAEEKLRQMADRWLLATRAANVGIWDYDVVNNRLIWDEAMYRLYGITPKQFSGAYQAWESGLHPDDLLRGREEIQMALKGEKEFDTEFRVIWPDQSVHYIKATGLVQRDALGTPLRMLGTNWDITDRKHTEAALKEVAEWLNRAQEIAHLGSWELDLTRNELVWSDEVYRIFGLAPQEVAPTYETFLDFVHPEDRSTVDMAYSDSVREERGAYEIEHRIVRRGTGEIRWVLEKCSHALDASGRIVRSVGMVHDITDQIHAQEEIREAINAAEMANQAKSDFLASMSHELRTPMNAILGFSQILQGKYYGELNNKQSEYVAYILESANHLLSLINDILDLSKVEAGKMELEISQVNVKALTENSLVMIKEKALHHGITLEFNVPPSFEGFEIEGDERKLKQVLFNLLSNAAKFTPDGGTISLTANRVQRSVLSEKKMSPNDEFDGDFLEISVADTGIGIREEDLERVFDPFIQVKSGMSDKTTGTGLGLSLSRRFVELHGGRIWCESEGEGKGSIFRLIIPVEQTKPDLKRPSSEAETIEPLEWKDEYSVGVALLDDWHKRIFETINLLIDTQSEEDPSKTCSGCLENIIQYSNEHFRDEEALLREWEYPHLEEQVRAHKSYVDRVSRFIEGKQRLGEPMHRGLLGYLRYWWINHIIEEDMRYKPFLAEKGIA